MITLAFYKGRAPTLWHRLQDAVIRLATRSQYSHVELISGVAQYGIPLECLSSSGRDGGVRAKTIVLNPAHWDLVELAIPSVPPEAFIRSRIGAGYDYVGVLLSHLLAFGGHDKRRWFCSELIAAALGLDNPQYLSPQLLFEVVTWNAAGPRILNS